jgi:phosphoribosyl 1,2-cyclic phosphodiesterase
LANLRIHFYGVQGSGSIFSPRAERAAFRELSDYELLRRVFADVARHADGSGRLNCLVEDILGGPVDPQTLLAYRRRFDVPEPRVYGGWTTCVRVETSDGHDLVFDCGSGFRNCAIDLQAKWGDRPARELHLFGSHSHFDHTEGFDQAAVCFDRRNTINVYGNRQFLWALDSNLGIFSHHVADEVRGVHTPLTYAIMPAGFRACEIRDTASEPPPTTAGEQDGRRFFDVREPIRIGRTTVRPFEVFHPAPCLAYRIDHGGRSFVFCTDHELRRGPDAGHPAQHASLAAEARLVEHVRGADLLYRDGQYLRAEYDGREGIGSSAPVPRLDWGHSCIEDVIEMARACRVRRTLIGHHDPNRNWADRNRLDSMLAQSGDGESMFEMARAETVIEL